jgi:hypothetical protein
MAPIYRYRFAWQGIPGAPGYTNLYAFNDTTEQVFADAARAFLSSALKLATAQDTLFGGASIQGDSVVEHVEVTDGTLVDSVPITAPAVILGTGTGASPAPCGAAVNWLTGAVHHGHRVRGRTFLVPLAAAAYESNGTLLNSYLTIIRNAAAAYIASAANPVVWSRPTRTPGSPGNNADGAAFTVVASQVNDKVAVLTSRRD